MISDRKREWNKSLQCLDPNVHDLKQGCNLKNTPMTTWELTLSGQGSCFPGLYEDWCARFPLTYLPRALALRKHRTDEWNWETSAGGSTPGHVLIKFHISHNLAYSQSLFWSDSRKERAFVQAVTDHTFCPVTENGTPAPRSKWMHY